MDDSHLRARGLAGSAGLLLGYLGLTGLLVWGSTGAYDAVRGPGPATLDTTIGLAAAVGAWVALSWLTLVTALTLLTAAVAGCSSRAHRRAAALAPVACRRLVAAMLGLAIVGAPLAASPLTAAPPAVAAERVVPAPALDRPAATVPAGWTPDRPAVIHRRDPAAEAAVRLVTAAPRTGLVVSDEVVVRRGDTLWEIAARHLGPRASAAEIAAEWPRWHRANRHAIGADPDLLLPGQRLVPPPGR